jgi:hypothetical protein
MISNKYSKHAGLLKMEDMGGGLKIRRWLAPWGFKFPSRRHDSKHLIPVALFRVENLKTAGVKVCMSYFV